MLDEVLKQLLYPDAKTFLEGIAVEWPTGTPYVLPTIFENMQDRLDSSKPYVQVEVITQAYAQRTFGSPGNNLFRKQGQLVFTVNAPVGVGTGLQEKVISAIEAFYSPQKTDLAGITFQTPVPSGSGIRSGDNWMKTVTVPFKADRRA